MHPAVPRPTLGRLSRRQPIPAAAPVPPAALAGARNPWWRPLPLVLLSGSLAGAEPCRDHRHGPEESPHHPAADLAEGSGQIHFHPYLNAAVALGGSTAEKNLGLPGGAHAPPDDGFNLQAIEFGGLLELTETVSLRANANVFWDRFDGWDGELEEAYLAVGLPGQARLRAGQMFVPFGLENDLHVHDRAFVEAPLSVTRLLGEEGLVARGAELSLPLPGHWQLRLGAGHGRDHAHGATREARRAAWLEAVEHAAGEEGPEEGEDHHSHGSAGLGGAYDPEQAYLTGPFGQIRAEGPLSPLVAGGFSFAAGENEGGRGTWVAGADLHGDFRIAERPAWWRAEAFFRDAAARDAAGLQGNFQESGAHAAAGCELAENWSVASRLEWASGNRLAGLERRWRFAAILGRALGFGTRADAHVRLQYTFDRAGGRDDEHTVWLQLLFNLGAAHHPH